jgi:hypothetical protein
VVAELRSASSGENGGAPADWDRADGLDVERIGIRILDGCGKRIGLRRPAAGATRTTDPDGMITNAEMPARINTTPDPSARNLGGGSWADG